MCIYQRFSSAITQFSGTGYYILQKHNNKNSISRNVLGLWQSKDSAAAAEHVGDPVCNLQHATDDNTQVSMDRRTKYLRVMSCSCSYFYPF